MLGFYGAPDTGITAPRTARARVWGISKAGADDFGGTYLGELILRMGNTSPGSGTFLNILNKFVCDIKVVAPDRSLTPPGMRVLGHDVNLGCAYVLLDAMGFLGIALQIRIDDPGGITNLGYVYRIL